MPDVGRFGAQSDVNAAQGITPFYARFLHLTTFFFFFFSPFVTKCEHAPLLTWPQPHQPVGVLLTHITAGTSHV